MGEGKKLKRNKNLRSEEDSEGEGRMRVEGQRVLDKGLHFGPDIAVCRGIRVVKISTSVFSHKGREKETGKGATNLRGWKSQGQKKVEDSCSNNGKGCMGQDKW